MQRKYVYFAIGVKKKKKKKEKRKGERREGLSNIEIIKDGRTEGESIITFELSRARKFRTI